MTREDELKGILEYCGAATPEWCADYGSRFYELHGWKNDKRVCLGVFYDDEEKLVMHFESEVGPPDVTFKEMQANAEFAENARTDLPTVTQELIEARELLGNLVRALDYAHSDDEFRAVWTIAQMHRGRYQGPRYEEELNAARDFLGNGSKS